MTYTGIVDERRFYSQATGNAHPLTAADYLDYPRMRAVLVALNNTPDGALLLPSGNYDQWDVVPAKPPPPDMPPELRRAYMGPHTVFFTNLGMLGMNVGLDVRVIDQIGLANPLAAHTARLEDGRIGHDKNLFPDWAVAEGPFLNDPSLDSAVSRRGLDRPGPGGAGMPRHRRHADVDPWPAGPAAVLVKCGARVRIHQVPDRPGADV